MTVLNIMCELLILLHVEMQGIYVHIKLIRRLLNQRILRDLVLDDTCILHIYVGVSTCSIIFILYTFNNVLYYVLYVHGQFFRIRTIINTTNNDLADFHNVKCITPRIFFVRKCNNIFWTIGCLFWANTYAVPILCNY